MIVEADTLSQQPAPVAPTAEQRAYDFRVVWQESLNDSEIERVGRCLAAFEARSDPERDCMTIRADANGDFAVTGSSPKSRAFARFLARLAGVLMLERRVPFRIIVPTMPIGALSGTYSAN
jgi:hypothetical protein